MLDRVDPGPQRPPRRLQKRGVTGNPSPGIVRLVDECVQLRLGQFRDVERAVRRHLDQIGARLDLLADRPPHVVRSVRFARDPGRGLRTMTAGHADDVATGEDARTRHEPLVHRAFRGDPDVAVGADVADRRHSARQRLPEIVGGLERVAGRRVERSRRWRQPVGQVRVEVDQSGQERPRSEIDDPSRRPAPASPRRVQPPRSGFRRRPPSRRGAARRRCRRSGAPLSGKAHRRSSRRLPSRDHGAVLDDEADAAGVADVRQGVGLQEAGDRPFCLVSACPVRPAPATRSRCPPSPSARPPTATDRPRPAVRVRGAATRPERRTGSARRCRRACGHRRDRRWS